MLWQYRTLLFEFTKDGLLGDKYVDDEEMEKTLNQLGGAGWELINVALLQDGVLAFLKKPSREGRVVEESVPTVEAIPETTAPMLRSRAAVMSVQARMPDPVFEAQREPRHESHLERGQGPQFGPVVHTTKRATEQVSDLSDVSDVGSIRIS